MKTILIIALMLVGISMQAQNYLLKEYYQIGPEGDTAWNYKYMYNEDFTIDTIATYLGNELRSIKYYENDTLFFSKSADGMTVNPYDYYDDSITIAHIYDGVEYSSYTHHLDEQDRIVWIVFNEEDPYMTDIFNVWEGDNISEQSYVINDDTTTHTATYHDYLNPKYNSLKYFRADFDGCYNQVKSFINSDGIETANYEVVELIGDYPVKVDIYGSGILTSSFHYVYVLIDDIKETPPEPYTVLSIVYYDIMGRSIKKPEKGFYFERKTTDKGIISKKYFIQ